MCTAKPRLPLAQDASSSAKLVKEKTQVMKVSVEVCSLCEGTGWKSVSIGSERRVTRCDCRLQVRAQTLLAAARIPKRYEHCELSNFESDGPHRQLASSRLAAGKFVEEYPVDSTGLLNSDAKQSIRITS